MLDQQKLHDQQLAQQQLQMQMNQQPKKKTKAKRQNPKKLEQSTSQKHLRPGGTKKSSASKQRAA
jgi:hypothetical protein